MARRRQVEEDDVSLFPFLSIIAAVIGVLTLMIAAVALDQMNQEDVKETVQRAIEMEIVRGQIAESEGLVEKLKLQLEAEKAKLLVDASQRQLELVKSRAELDALIRQLQQAKEDLQTKQKVKIVIPEVPEAERETIADMQGQLAAIKERLAILDRQLKERNKPPEESQVTVTPGGSGLRYKPIFVECAAGAIVLHTEKPPLRIRAAEIPANAKFVALMEKVANSPQHSMIFLLRSDGLGVYRAAKRLCDTNDVRNGKLPVVGNGRLDLSRFADAK